jgi:hypothetical protein
MALLIVWHLRKVVPRLEVLLSINTGACTNSMTFSWVIWSLLCASSYYNGFKSPKVSKQVTAGKRRHVTLTIPLKTEKYLGGLKW